MSGIARCLSALALIVAGPVRATAQTLEDPRLEVVTYVDGLDQPTAFAFIGPDQLLVMEKRSGQVLMVRQGKVRQIVLDLKVNFQSERGGLGVEADPDFDDNDVVYARQRRFCWLPSARRSKRDCYLG